MTSVRNKGVWSSFVAPMNCSKQGCRHLEAMSISRSNNLRLWGERIKSCIVFTATTQPQNLPWTTSPQAPLPRDLVVSWIWLRGITHSGDLWAWLSRNICRVVERLVSSSVFYWYFLLSCSTSSPIIMIYMKNLSASDRLKTDAFFMWYECKVQEEASFPILAFAVLLTILPFFKKFQIIETCVVYQAYFPLRKDTVYDSEITGISRSFSSC